MFWHIRSVLFAVGGASALAALDSPNRISVPGFVLLSGAMLLLPIVNLARVVRFPTRTKAAVDQKGGKILCVAKWRPITVVGTCGLWLGALIGVSEKEPGWEWVVLGFVACMWLFFMVYRERYRLTDAGIERSGGVRPAKRLEWLSIKQVSAFRDVIFLTDVCGRELSLSMRWFDGFAEMASVVLQRVPAHAFPDDGVRERIQRHAAGHCK